MFKSSWEKTSLKRPLPEGLVEKMVSLGCPNKKIVSSTHLAGGCANINIKIQLENEGRPLILRIYLRDKDAAHREQKLGALLKTTVQIPLVYYVGEVEGHHFTITEFLPGIPLRDLLLGDAAYDLSAVMHEVGRILARITARKFSRSGFFDKDLEVMDFVSFDGIKFASNCLNSPTVLSVLDSLVVLKIQKAIELYGHLLPTDHEKNLVHGDFDPANILVNQRNGSWVVVAILDWEFSFSGSYLWDVANMLRYAHKMPPEFQGSFLKGLRFGGMNLAENWSSTIHLLNILSLLDLLKRSNPQIYPLRCADIAELMDYHIYNLDVNVLDTPGF